MSVSTLPLARDEIQSAFKVAWDAGTPAIMGSIPEVYYEGVGKPAIPDPEKAFAEVFIRHVTGGQATLSDGNARRRFEKVGILAIQVFAPLLAAGGLGKGELLAEVAKNAFEGKSTASGVWFRDVRAIEVGITGPWFQWNVVGDFRYDEFI